MRKPCARVFNVFVSLGKKRSFQILIALVILHVLFVSLESPLVFKIGFDSFCQGSLARPQKLVIEMQDELGGKQAPSWPLKSLVFKASQTPTPSPSPRPSPRSRLPEMRNTNILSSLRFDWEITDANGKNGSRELYKFASTAWELGRKLWEDLDSGNIQEPIQKSQKQPSKCPSSISLTELELRTNGTVMELPCGLTLGSNVTIVGKPRKTHWARRKKKSTEAEGEEPVKVSKFIIELQGLKEERAREPTRVFHLNPRLSGDLSGKPVIEQNTYHRGQWGRPQRCIGSLSKPDELTVDGQVKCEEWINGNKSYAEEKNMTQDLIHLKGIDLPFPFGEERLFLLTLSVGVEGYHAYVDGKHVTSFPHRTDLTPEDAIRLSIEGDIDVHLVFANSLPPSRKSLAPQRQLEFSSRWQAPPLANQQFDMFIGILSAGDHFAERMTVRRTWMQHELVQTSKVAARFFVALHAREEVNFELKKEAEFFGDIAIVPYLDHYDLVVLKTLAICEYGARRVSAKYVMKCDDDTFVRLDEVINEAKKVPQGKSLYIGNMNYHHKPFRKGKWSVTLDEWPDEDYPTYADGPGYIVSNDIASFIANEFEEHRLRLFKMEDVSMGIWVETFRNGTNQVDYRHSVKFCQFGCMKNYITAHYQSPKQMACLWNKLNVQGRAECCR